MRFSFGRFLTFESLFDGPRGFCKNCGVRLSGRYKTFCKDCQGSFDEYDWQIVSNGVIQENGVCKRCGRESKWDERLEASHVRSVEEIQSTLPYTPMSKHEFMEANMIESRMVDDWSTENLEKWRQQMLTNRQYMHEVLNPKNLIVKCRGCHDYEHARRNIIRRLNKSMPNSENERKIGELLRALDRENSPELIRGRGYRRPKMLEVTV
jgi:RecJ-like exonuclease